MRTLRLWTLGIVILIVGLGAAPGSAGAQNDDPEWLRWINYYRAMAGLPVVEHEPSYDVPVQEHARYLVELDQEGLCPIYPHCEAIPPGTPVGDEGARNILMWSTGPLSEREVVEGLFAAPFHGQNMLRPGLRRVGYGYYENLDREPKGSVGVINTKSDPSPTDVSQVVTWPSDRALSPLVEYPGREVPEPLDAASCRSLDLPTRSDVSGDYRFAGLPIMVLNAPDGPLDAVVTDVTTGNALEHCVVTRDDFEPGSGPANSLEAKNSFFVIPVEPLERGHEFRVQISGAVDLDFTFWTIERPDDAPPPSAALLPVGADPPDADPTPGTDVPQSTIPGSTSPTTTIPVDDGGSPTTTVVPPLPSPPSATGGSFTSTDRPWIYLPFALGLGLVGGATAWSIRRTGEDPRAGAVAVVGVGMALVSPLFFTWGETRIGVSVQRYRGVDYLGVGTFAGALTVCTLAAGVMDLAAGRRPGAVAKGALILVATLSGILVGASELMSGVGLVSGAARRFGADVSVGPGPWVAFFLGLVGLIWAFVPARGIAVAVTEPFRYCVTHAHGIVAGLVTLLGVAAVVMSRYVPWVKGSAFGEDVEILGRNIPFVASFAFLGVGVLLLALMLFGLGRSDAGLVVGGIASSMMVFPGMAAVVAADELGDSGVTDKLLEAASDRFAGLDPSIEIGAGPWLMFAGGLVCTAAVVLVGWDADPTRRRRNV